MAKPAIDPTVTPIITWAETSGAKRRPTVVGKVDPAYLSHLPKAMRRGRVFYRTGIYELQSDGRWKVIEGSLVKKGQIIDDICGQHRQPEYWRQILDYETRNYGALKPGDRVRIVQQAAWIPPGHLTLTPTVHTDSSAFEADAKRGAKKFDYRHHALYLMHTGPADIATWILMKANAVDIAKFVPFVKDHKKHKRCALQGSKAFKSLLRRLKAEGKWAQIKPNEIVRTHLQQPHSSARNTSRQWQFRTLSYMTVCRA
ncbi:MAG: hypothetical protein AB7G06_05060 [Bdellovibrionales bacterium]